MSSSAKPDDRKFVLGAILALIMLITSGGGLLYIFFGAFGQDDFERVPIQKTVRIEMSCPPESVSTSYVVNADRDNGYVAVIFYGVGTSGRVFPFQACESIRVFTDELQLGELSIANNFAFENTRRTPTPNDPAIAWDSNGPGWISFDPASIEESRPAFSVHIPVDELLSRNGSDTWAVDLQFVSVFPDTGVVPNGILPYALELLTDPDLVVDSLEPALARTRPNPNADASYSITLQNREVVGNDPLLLGLDDDTQLNTINDLRLQLTLRDPDYAVRRDVGILVLSTLFGIAVTVMFETFLVLSVRQSLKAIPGGTLQSPSPNPVDQPKPTLRKDDSMAFPDLPPTVKAMLASEGHRVHHHLWHFVRNEENWTNLPQEDRDELTTGGWAAPHFDQQPGSGIDFLGMHRQMIAMVNAALQAAGDPNWPDVTGWNPIPFDADDTDWPVPAWQSSPPPWADGATWQSFTDLANHARSDARVEEMKAVAGIFRDPARLATMTLDDLGIQMEWSIHGWMHMRWSGSPADDAFSTDPSNDWLFLPWSSHVNKTFWKLHGWIDERITDWENATGQTADLTGAWAGPPPPPGAMMHMADARLLRHLPALEEVPMPMSVREPVIEGLLGQHKH